MAVYAYDMDSKQVDWCGRCPLISVGFIKRNVLYVEQSWQFFGSVPKQVKVTTCPHISKPSKALRSFVLTLATKIA
jgi:hypothetical protein